MIGSQGIVVKIDSDHLVLYGQLSQQLQSAASPTELLWPEGDEELSAESVEAIEQILTIQVECRPGVKGVSYCYCYC